MAKELLFLYTGNISLTDNVVILYSEKYKTIGEYDKSYWCQFFMYLLILNF
jgi:hypothetical protein